MQPADSRGPSVCLAPGSIAAWLEVQGKLHSPCTQRGLGKRPSGTHAIVRPTPLEGEGLGPGPLRPRTCPSWGPCGPAEQPLVAVLSNDVGVGRATEAVQDHGQRLEPGQPVATQERGTQAVLRRGVTGVGTGERGDGPLHLPETNTVQGERHPRETGSPAAASGQHGGVLGSGHGDAGGLHPHSTPSPSAARTLHRGKPSRPARRVSAFLRGRRALCPRLQQPTPALDPDSATGSPPGPCTHPCPRRGDSLAQSRSESRGAEPSRCLARGYTL